MDTVTIDGVEYCKQTGGDCVNCVGRTDHEICEALPDDCLDEKQVFWLRKPVANKQAELNAFFGRPLTTQMELFPETLAVTQEEEEDWQALQKKVATGVTDGPAERAIRELSSEEYIKKIGTDPLDVQVGGGHYKDCKIQPVEYIHANKLGYCEANVVKYITRWRDKGGKKDLEKAKHYIDLLIQLEGL